MLIDVGSGMVMDQLDWWGRPAPGNDRPATGRRCAVRGPSEPGRLYDKTTARDSLAGLGQKTAHPLGRHGLMAHMKEWLAAV